MANCPFCSSVLLRHIRSGQVYWFCRRCRTEVLKTNVNEVINLSAPLESLVSGRLTNVKLNESKLNESSPSALSVND
jgi:ribosomal protein L37AE/L43A